MNRGSDRASPMSPVLDRESVPVQGGRVLVRAAAEAARVWGPTFPAVIVRVRADMTSARARHAERLARVARDYASSGPGLVAATGNRGRPCERYATTGQRLPEPERMPASSAADLDRLLSGCCAARATRRR